MGCHFLLQGIFPTQESNLRLLYCRLILYQLSYKGSLLKSLNESKGLERLKSNLIFTIGDYWSKLWSILGDGMGFPGGSEVKASASNAGDVGSMQETWVRSLGREDPLENEMATQSSILAWRIPWMEEPGGL